MTIQDLVFRSRSVDAAMVGLVALAGAPAAAQSTDSPVPTAAGTATVVESPNDALVGRESSPFRLSFMPFAWLTSFSGTAGARGLKFEIDESFTDVLDEADSLVGLMGALDMNYKRFVFQINGTYTQADFSGKRGRVAQGPGAGGLDFSLDGDVQVNAGWYEAFGGYRLLERTLGDRAASNSRFVLDGFIGGRFTDMEIQQDITARAAVTLPDGRMLEAGRSESLNQDKGWFEPFVGARAAFKLGEHWGVVFRGDVGGFGVDGSQFAWQTIGVVGYEWKLEDWSIGLYAGIRALGQDYTEEGFTWDMVTYGPLIGAEFSFFF